MGGKRYRLTGSLVVAVGLFALSACNEPVAGTAGTSSAKPAPKSSEVTETTESSEAAESSEPETTAKRTTVTVRPRTTTKAPADPGIPAIDQSAPAQYCDEPFTGALGKKMLAVVVETPGGILDCNEAASILFDYYAARPEPKTGLDPFEIGPLRCNQVPEPDLPQVVCAGDDNIIYSMWPQT